MTVTNSDLGTVLETDVLVLGGGLAGIFAALSLREQGRDVLIVEKANIRRSGEAGAGNDHFMGQLYTDPSWDTDVNMGEYMVNVSGKFIEPELTVKLAGSVSRVKDILESLGMDFHRDPKTGQYLRTGSFASRGPFMMMIKGSSAKQLKPVLVAALEQKGARVLNRVMATKLLVKDGQVAGVTGFGIRDGKFYTIRAKSVIFATGNVSRTCAESMTNNAFNLWRSPFNTGDGHTMAWKAGMEMEDMGILGGTLVPKGFGSPGINGLIGLGGYLVNALGERFMFKYDPKGEKAERPTIVMATFKEIQEGRGPCYFDLRHLPIETIEFIRKNLLSVDRDTFDDFLTQKGLDPSKELMEYEVGEHAKYCGGIAVDLNLETNLPRVFAVGQCGVGDSFTTAATSGYLAGIQAAAAVADVKELAPLDSKEIAAEKARVLAPMQRKEGIAPEKLERMIRQINENYLHIARNETSIKTALNSLRKLSAYAENVKASNYHELMRAHEALNLLLCSELIALSSLDRKESRFGAGFYRSDYPNPDPALNGMLMMKQVNGEIVQRFKPIDPDGFEKLRQAEQAK